MKSVKVGDKVWTTDYVMYLWRKEIPLNYDPGKGPYEVMTTTEDECFIYYEMDRVTVGIEWEYIITQFEMRESEINKILK